MSFVLNVINIVIISKVVISIVVVSYYDTQLITSVKRFTVQAPRKTKRQEGRRWICHPTSCLTGKSGERERINSWYWGPPCLNQFSILLPELILGFLNKIFIIYVICINISLSVRGPWTICSQVLVGECNI
jgi:hypothetical protein